MKGFTLLKNFILLFSMLFLCFFRSDAQQVVKTEIINNGGTIELDLIDPTDLDINGEVLQNQVDLYGLDANVDGGAQWILEDFTISETVLLRLKDFNNNPVTCNFKIENGQLEIFWEQNGTTSVLESNRPFQNLDVLKIERNNGNLIWFQNGIELHSIPNLNSQNIGMYAKMIVTNSGIQNASPPNITFTFPESVSTTSGSVNICLTVNNNEDDAEESGSGLELFSNDLDLGNKIVGLRFNGLAIPAGANIINADIQFTVQNIYNGSTPSDLTITGHLIPDAPAFDPNNNNDISTRLRTSNSVDWPISSWTIVGEAGSDQLTANISSIISELISQPGFENNNSIVIIIEALGSNNGERAAVSHFFNPISAPELCITYESPSNPPPIPPADTRTYTKLKKELDGSYVQLECSKINFQYIEDYAITSGENEQIE